jgi:hypothetical protein
MCSVRNTLGTGQNNFLKRNSAGITFGEVTAPEIGADVPAYNPIVGIYRRTGV